MNDAFKINLKNKQSTKKIVVLMFLMCFTFATLLSEIFILTHANHEHNRDDVSGGCTTCIQIQNAENLLKQVIVAVGNVLSALFPFFITIMILSSVSYLFGLHTLVTLKIRMNN